MGKLNPKGKKYIFFPFENLKSFFYLPTGNFLSLYKRENGVLFLFAKVRKRFFPFGKGERMSFFFAKKKKDAKEVGDLAGRMPVRVEAPDRQSPLDSARKPSLCSELSAWRKGVSPLAVLCRTADRMEAFLLVRRRDGYFPHSPILVPPSFV